MDFVESENKVWLHVRTHPSGATLHDATLPSYLRDADRQ